MTAPEHSPLPWRAEKDCPCSLVDANGASLAILNEADVQLIVAAVNSPAGLLAAGLLATVRSRAELLAAAKRVIAAVYWSPNRGTFCEDDSAFKALSAAIANAEKGAP